MDENVELRTLIVQVSVDLLLNGGGDDGSAEQVAEIVRDMMPPDQRPDVRVLEEYVEEVMVAMIAAAIVAQGDLIAKMDGGPPDEGPPPQDPDDFPWG